MLALAKQAAPEEKVTELEEKLKKYDFLALAKEEKVPKMEETQKV